MTKKSNFLKELVSQLTEEVPEHFQVLKKDFEKHCHNALTKTLNKLDLVTREEFDIQTKVLLRTRKKLDEIEEQIRKLERKRGKKED